MADYYLPLHKAHDRTGVMRRQLFQVVDRDTRVNHAPPVVLLPADHEPGSDWKLLLVSVCHDAVVADLTDKVCEAAEALGVALPSELRDVGGELCDRVCMKPLQRRRFLAQLQKQTNS